MTIQTSSLQPVASGSILCSKYLTETLEIINQNEAVFFFSIGKKRTSKKSNIFSETNIEVVDMDTRKY